jgi:iron(III) transport system permease protein
MRRSVPSRRFTRRRLATSAWLGAAVVLWVFMDPRMRGLLENSFWLAICTSAATIPPAMLLATFLIKFDVPGRRVAWILLISGLFLPLYLVATAWESAFGLQGSIASLLPLAGDPLPPRFASAVFIHSIAVLPVVTLIIAAGLASVERSLEEDALLAASPSRVLLQITWRRSLVAVFVAVVWVVIVCLGEMTVTDLFQIRTFAEEVYVQTAGGAIWDLAGGAGEPVQPLELSQRSFLVAVLLLVVLLAPAIVLCLRLVRRWQRAATARRWTIQPRQGGLVGTAVLLILFMLIGLPLGSLCYHAGGYTERTAEGYLAHWSLVKGLLTVARAPVLHAREFLHTAIIAAASASAAVIASVGLGLWATFHFSGKAAAGFAAAMLAAVPGPLVGLWTIHVLNQPPESPLAFLAVLYDEDEFGVAPWLVQTLRVLPFAVLVAVPAMLGTPRGLLETASLDGMGICGKIRHVFLPLHWRSFAVAWLVALVLALGELPATVLVVPPGVTPLSVRIFNLVHYGVDDQLAGLVLFVWTAVLILTAVIVLLATRPGRHQL